MVATLVRWSGARTPQADAAVPPTENSPPDAQGPSLMDGASRTIASRREDFHAFV